MKTKLMSKFDVGMQVRVTDKDEACDGEIGWVVSDISEKTDIRANTWSVLVNFPGDASNELWAFRDDQLEQA